MSDLSSAYTRFDIPGYRVSWREGDRIVVREVPAHAVFLSMPWERRRGLRGDPVEGRVAVNGRARRTRRRREDLIP